MLNFQINKISDQFGVEVIGLDVSKNLNEKDVKVLKDLFNENHVIVFRKQNLSDEEQLSFTENFGELEVYPEADKTKDSQKTYHVANVNLDGKHLTDQDEQVIFQKVNQRNLVSKKAIKSLLPKNDKTLFQKASKKARFQKGN